MELLQHTAYPLTEPLATGPADRTGLLFVGRLNDPDSPNVDSITRFAAEVFPLLRETSVSLRLVGMVNDDVVPQVPGMTYVGPVQDLDPEYSRARVFVAPTRSAVGIPLKVIDAAGAGIPIVLTPILAAQLGWRHRREVLIADSPQEFASHICELLRDDDLWSQLRTTAHRSVSQQFSEGVQRRSVDRLLHRAVAARRPQRLDSPTQRTATAQRQPV